MRALYEVPAPAKLNLFLHVTGRRADGYHLLQSAFMLIDWCDTLHFERRTGGSITREDWHGAAGRRPDRACRAALQVATGCTEGAHRRAETHSGAGRPGGGSSDAATPCWR